MITTTKTIPTTMTQASIWLWLFAGLGVVIAMSVLSFVIFQPITVLPRITLAPGFNLINQDGNRVSNEDLRGQLTLYSFSHASCDRDCAQSHNDINALRIALSNKLPQDFALTFVTISLNPTHDTPEILQNVMPVQAEGIEWQWLTGDAQRVRYAVGGGFDLYYKLQADDAVKFEPRYVLVDQNGLIRARYLTAVPDPTLLLRDINYLVQESASNEGATAIAYEAAHLFLCYPR